MRFDKLCFALLVLVVGAVHAQDRPTGLHPAYVLTPSPALVEGAAVPMAHPGRWDRPALDDFVVEGTPGQPMSQGVVRRLRNVTRSVYVCAAPVPLKQADGCPTPGVYTGERYGALGEVWTRTTRVISCFPDVTFPVKVWDSALPAELQTPRSTRIAVWACKTPTGYVNEVWRYSAASIAEELSRAAQGVFDEQAARTRCTQDCVVDLDPVRRAKIQELVTPHLASVRVSPSGSQTSRPVYALNAQGVRSTAALPNVRVPVGNNCRVNMRVSGTSYYDVSGAPNVATSDPNDVIPERVVALCTLRTPHGVNR